jgi:hypothetical protein
MNFKTLIKKLKQKAKDGSLNLIITDCDEKNYQKIFPILGIESLFITANSNEELFIEESDKTYIKGSGEIFGTEAEVTLLIRNDLFNQKVITNISFVLKSIDLTKFIPDLDQYTKVVLEKVIQFNNVFLSIDGESNTYEFLSYNSGQSLELSNQESGSNQPKLSINNLGFKLTCLASKDLGYVDDIQLQLSGQLAVGRSSVDTVLTLPVSNFSKTNLFSISISSRSTLNQGFTDLEYFTGINIIDNFPESFQKLFGNIIIRNLYISFSCNPFKIYTINFDLDSKADLPLTDKLILEEVILKGNVKFGEGLNGLSLFLSGKLKIEPDQSMLVSINIPANKQDWEIAIDNTLDEGLILKFSQLLGLLPDSLELELPDKIKDIGIRLGKFDLLFNPFSSSNGRPILSKLLIDMDFLIDWEIFDGFTISKSSLSLEIDSAKNISGFISGTFLFGENPLTLLAIKQLNGWLFRAYTEPGDLIKISDLLGKLKEQKIELPDAFKNINFQDIDIEIDTMQKYFVFKGTVNDSIPISFGNKKVNLSLGINLIYTPEGTIKLNGILAGELIIDGNIISVSYILGKTNRISFGYKNNDQNPFYINSIITNLIDENIVIPKEVPQFEIVYLSGFYDYNESLFGFSGGASIEWNLFDNDKTFTTDFSFNIERKKETKPNKPPYYYDFGFHAEAAKNDEFIPIVDNFSIKNIVFDFIKQGTTWNISGSLDAKLFDVEFSLSAAYSQTKESKTITIQTKQGSDPKDLRIGNITFSVTKIDLTIKKSISAEGQPTSDYEITGTINAKLDDADVTLGVTTQNKMLVFIADIKNIQLTKIIEKISGIELPEGAPDISITDFNFGIVPKAGAFLVNLKDLEAKWKLGDKELDVKLNINILKGLSTKSVPPNQQINIKGVDYLLDNTAIDGSIGVTLTGTSDPNEPLIRIPSPFSDGALATFGASEIKFSISQGSTPVNPNGSETPGGELPPATATSSWKLEARSNVAVFNPFVESNEDNAIINVDGSIVIYEKQAGDTDLKGFSFIPTPGKGLEIFPLSWFGDLVPEELASIFEIQLKAASILYKKDSLKDESNWGFDIDIAFKINKSTEESFVYEEFYKLIDSIFPPPKGNAEREIIGKISVVDGNISVSIINTIGVVIPDIFAKIKNSKSYMFTEESFELMSDPKVNIDSTVLQLLKPLKNIPFLTEELFVEAISVLLKPDFESSIDKVKEFNRDWEIVRKLKEILPEFGESYFLLKSLTIGTKPPEGSTTSTNFNLDARVIIGLPSKLNDIFFSKDSKYYGIIRTYNPDDPTNIEKLIEAQIGLSFTDGLSFSGNFLKFPVDTSKILGNGIDETPTTLTFDLDKLFSDNAEGDTPTTKYGKFSLEKPIVNLSPATGTFSVIGGYSIVSDFLYIPLSFITKHLESLFPEKFKDSFPSGIPIKSIDFIDKQTNTFQTKSLEDWISLLLHNKEDAFSFPSEIKRILDSIGKEVDKLPKRFKEYLAIKIPKAIHFGLNISPQSFNVLLEVPQQKPEDKSEDKSNDFSDCIQLLLVNPLFPVLLYGIRLQKFGLGTVLGGTLLRLDLSAEFDQFDLITLGTSLLLPDKILPGQPDANTTANFILPDKRNFARTIEAKDLLMFITYETVVPIPIPIFYNPLRIYYAGIEGLETELQLMFSQENNSLLEIIKKFSEYKKFFTDSDDSLYVGSHPLAKAGIPDTTNLRQDSHKFYMQLPGYIGYEFDEMNTLDEKGNPLMHPIMIGTKEPFKINILDLIDTFLNSSKFLVQGKDVPVKILKDGEKKIDSYERPINYLIEFIELEKRMSTKHIKLFFLFDIYTAWVFSTPKEFVDIAYDKMNKLYENLSGTQMGEDGVVIPNSEVPNLAIPAKSSPQYLMDLLIAEDEIVDKSKEDQGAITMFRGGLKISDYALFEAAIGMLLSSQRGLRAGIALNGKVMNWIEMAALFFVKVNPQAEEFFKILGNMYFKVFDHTIIEGFIEVTPEHLAFRGLLDLFPKESSIQLKGFANGVIASDSFFLEAQGMLALGEFRAIADLLIDTLNDKFTIDLVFGSSELHASLVHSSQGEIDIIDAKFAATILKNLFTLVGNTNIKRDSSSIQINGNVSTSLLAGEIAYLDMTFKGGIDMSNGVLYFQAELTPNSYLFSPNFRPHGGAAFYVWFDGVNNGDFVISIGGYHPNFTIPAHYPKVPRLGIDWWISDTTSIKGEAYFALTGSGIMAGGRLSLNYNSGSKAAWFTAYMDFLAKWKPFYFNAEIGVNIGASYRVGAGKLSKTFEVSVGAVVNIWGPPMGGYVSFKIATTKIKIHFGDDPRTSVALSKWDDFQAQFLSDELFTFSAERGLTDIVTKVVTDTATGVEKKLTTWIVRPDEFEVCIGLNAPATEVNDQSTNAHFRIDMLGWKDVTSNVTITLVNDADALQKNILTSDSIQLKSSKVPTALWGDTSADPLNKKNFMVENLTTGVGILPFVPTSGTIHITDMDTVAPEVIFKEGNSNYSFPLQIPNQTSAVHKVTLSNIKNTLTQDSQIRSQMVDELLSLNLPYNSEYTIKAGAYEKLADIIESDWLDIPKIVKVNL